MYKSELTISLVYFMCAYWGEPTLLQILQMLENNFLGHVYEKFVVNKKEIAPRQSRSLEMISSDAMLSQATDSMAENTLDTSFSIKPKLYHVASMSRLASNLR